MTSVVVETYSEKAIVVRNTLEHHGPILTSLGGTFNDRLKGGRGWIFPKHMLTQVRNMIEKLNSGQYGNEYEQKTTSSSTSVDMVSKADYLSLLARVERLEALVLKTNPVHDIVQERMTKIVVKEQSPPKSVAKEHKIRHDDVPSWVDEMEETNTEKKRLVPVKLAK